MRGTGSERDTERHRQRETARSRAGNRMIERQAALGKNVATNERDAVRGSGTSERDRQ